MTTYYKAVQDISDRELFDELDHHSLNGCIHGFKPSRNCHNTDCQDKNRDAALSDEWNRRCAIPG
ncbi:hypothetical protein KGP36_07495, partial [Patescibacteria group bacterium]|nr:hypothetical protein [Patescibacteria group bacterium]